MKNLIKKNIKRMNYQLRRSNLYWKTSAGNMILLSQLKQLLPKYCKGKVLDAGAGHLLYKDLLKPYFERYESMDFEKTHPNLTYVCDIQNMKEIKSNQYDFVFCRNVLEHVPDPQKAINEIQRVLKKDGTAIITVPHLGYLHNEPHDYWRFTKYSLHTIATNAELKPTSVIELGGLIAFKAYIFQTLFMGLLFGIPIVKWIAFGINFVSQKIFVVLDKIVPTKKLFPLNYMLVVKK